MNGPQEARYARRLAEYATSTDLTPGIQSLIWTLACVEIEEETLQDYCNEHGTCYQVVGTAGDLLSKMRPEWNQLKEARLRKQALIARIEHKMRGVEETEDTTEQYFG